jgi:hypothetical protein
MREPYLFIKELQQAIEESVTALEPPLPDPPQPVTTDPGDDGWLFDSSREYMEQLKHYKTPDQWQKMHATMRSKHKVCPECGTSFVAVPRAVYCGGTCRKRGNRKRWRENNQRRAKKG